IDQHHGFVARQHEVVLGLCALDVELVLEPGTAAALDQDPQHRALGLGFEDFPDPPGRALGYGHACHESACPARIVMYAAGSGQSRDVLVSTRPYAAAPAARRGRRRPEPPSATRSAFRRDADRIIHSTAFRRLKHKTQVFVFHEGDHYRTRLSHTLEVTQIARALARALGLDEDLTEALALAHDLGHPPFGHAGERALDACLADFGGFDHNAQTLRTVTATERRYPTFDGL